jgi:hypothetical protein
LPVLKVLYNKSEARFFDLYEQGIKVLKGLSYILFVGVDRTIDWVYEKFVTFIGRTFSRALSWAHSGNYANYLAWCIAGLVIIILFIGKLIK